MFIHVYSIYTLTQRHNKTCTKLSINNHFINSLFRLPTICATFTKLTSEAK